MGTTNPFRKAEKRQARLRLALQAPPGAGKTWTALALAHAITGPSGRVAVIDSERGSSELYADRWDFEVAPFYPPYSPQRYVDLIRAGDTLVGPDGVVIIDSLSHGWEGAGGVQSIVDDAAGRAGGNSWAGWAKGTPEYRRLIDAIYATSCHVIATMRTKVEWAEGENARGKRTYTRIGTAPVMRPGVEYEFSVVGEIDLASHDIAITKSRAGTALRDTYPAGAPGSTSNAADLGGDLVAWLTSGEAPAEPLTLDGFRALCAERGVTDVTDVRQLWRAQGITEEMLRQDPDEVRRLVNAYRTATTQQADPAPAEPPAHDPPADAEPAAGAAAATGVPDPPEDGGGDKPTERPQQRRRGSTGRNDVGDDGLRKWERDDLVAARNTLEEAVLADIDRDGSPAARAAADALRGEWAARRADRQRALDGNQPDPPTHHTTTTREEAA